MVVSGVVAVPVLSMVRVVVPVPPVFPVPPVLWGGFPSVVAVGLLDGCSGRVFRFLVVPSVLFVVVVVGLVPVGVPRLSCRVASGRRRLPSRPPRSPIRLRVAGSVAGRLPPLSLAGRPVGAPVWPLGASSRSYLLSSPRRVSFLLFGSRIRR